MVASGGHEKRLRLFDLETPANPRDLGRHDGTIKSVVWDRTDKSDNVVLSSGDDKKLIWWDIRSPKPVTVHVNDSGITSVEQSCDNRFIVLTGGKSVSVFDSGRFISIPSHTNHSHSLIKKLSLDYEVSSASIHLGAERFVAGGSSDPWIRVHDYETGKQLGDRSPLRFD